MIKIPTANLGFLMMVSSEKLSSGNCDNNQQPEMEMYPLAAPVLPCLSLSRSLGNAFDHLVVVENLEFVVGISMISVIVPEM